MEVFGKHNMFLLWCLLWDLFSMCIAHNKHNNGVDACTRSGHLEKEKTRMFQGTCYYFDKDRQLTNAQAEQFCENVGGYLAMLKSRAVNKFVSQTLHKSFKRYFRGPNHFWIGLFDKRKEGSYEWIDGTPMTYDSFDKYQGSKSDWDHPRQDCTVIDGRNGKWRDYPCYRLWLFPKTKRSFICQYPPEATTLTTKIHIHAIEPTPKIISIVSFEN